MIFWENVRIALFSIFAHRMRSLLTMTGIVIGVASVITIVAIGQSGEAALKSSFSNSGNNTVDIEFRYDDEILYIPEESGEPLFTESDILALSKIPGINRVIAINNNSTNARYLRETLYTQVIGMSDGYYDVHSLTLVKGRFIEETDLSRGRKVAMIDETVQTKLMKGKDPIGEYVEIEGVPLKVIGVVKDTNRGIFQFGSEKLIVPRSVWPVLYGKDDISTLTIQAADAESLESAGQQAVDLLNSMKKGRQQLNGEYYIFNLEQIRESIATISRIMTLIVGSIAGISLFVGGIGVMNIMLVSVTERTKEIGIRKALGATRGEILLQFLVEAAVLTTIGGIIGILIGIGGSRLVSLFTKWPPVVSLPVIAIGILFSMLIGIVFGLLPANRAAKLMPIEALRYD